MRSKYRQLFAQCWWTSSTPLCWRIWHHSQGLAMCFKLATHLIELHVQFGHTFIVILTVLCTKALAFGPTLYQIVVNHLTWKKNTSSTVCLLWMMGTVVTSASHSWDRWKATLHIFMISGSISVSSSIFFSSFHATSLKNATHNGAGQTPIVKLCLIMNYGLAFTAAFYCGESIRCRVAL